MQRPPLSPVDLCEGDSSLEFHVKTEFPTDIPVYCGETASLLTCDTNNSTTVALNSQEISSMCSHLKWPALISRRAIYDTLYATRGYQYIIPKNRQKMGCFRV